MCVGRIHILFQGIPQWTREGGAPTWSVCDPYNQATVNCGNVSIGAVE